MQLLIEHEIIAVVSLESKLRIINEYIKLSG